MKETAGAESMVALLKYLYEVSIVSHIHFLQRFFLPSSSRDDAANKKTNDDSGGLHDGCAEAFADNDGDEDAETKADELCRTPGQSMRRVDIRTQLEQTRCRARLAVSRSASPILESRLHELDADEHDGRAGDERWENLLEQARRGEGHENFEKSTACCGTKDRAVAVRARELLTSGRGWAVSCCVHLAESSCSDGDGGEAGADD